MLTFVPIVPSEHYDEVLEQTRREWPAADLQTAALIGRTMRAARIMELEVEDVLSDFDLRIGEMDVLGALRRAGPPFELSPSGLVHLLMRSSTAMTNRIDRLVDRGLVERLPSRQDRRLIYVRLTPEGYALSERAFVAMNRRMASILEGLPVHERQELDRLLRALLKSFNGRVGALPNSDA